MTARARIAGAIAAGAYVAVALAMASVGPILPLYDGQAPPSPYRWVTPPDDAQTNEPALGGRQEIDLAAEVVVPLNATTDDGQAVVTGTEQTFAPVGGQRMVVVTIDPLDPETLAEPPEDLRFDGNAYRIEARYQPSGEPAGASEPITVVLRYAAHATDILQLDGDRWVRVRRPTGVPAVLQVYAQTRELGTYVVAGPEEPFNATPWIAGGLGALAVGALIVARIRLDRKARARAKTAPKAKRKRR